MDDKNCVRTSREFPHPKRIKLATWENRTTQGKALELAKKKNVQLLSLLEIEKIIGSKKLFERYGDCIPCWTSIHVKYSGTDCVAVDLSTGKKLECKIPEDDGWYKVNKFGLPFGEASNSEDTSARYLWRIDSYCGLVSRGGYGGFGRDGRIVRCVDGDYRCGVLATSIKTHRVGDILPRINSWASRSDT